MWDFETIDTAGDTDESGLFEMEPMNELKVGNDVQLRSIVKSVDPNEPTMWYAQVSKTQMNFKILNVDKSRLIVLVCI